MSKELRFRAILCETLYIVSEIKDGIASYETYSGKEKIIKKRPVTDFELIFTICSHEHTVECKAIYARNGEYDRFDLCMGFLADECEYGLLEFCNPDEVLSLEELYEELLKIYGSRIKQPMYVPFGDGYKTHIHIDGIEFQVYTVWGFVSIMPENVKDKETGNEYIREIVRHFRNSPEYKKKYIEKYPSKFTVVE